MTTGTLTSSVFEGRLATYCPAPGAGRRTSVTGKHQHPVDPPGDARIRVSELVGQHRLRRTLPGDRTQETPDGRRADRSVRSVGRRPRTAVMLRPRDGDAGGVAVVDEPA